MRPPKKAKRQQVKIACIPCRQSHSSCNSGRPCQRCLKLNLNCFDGPPRRIAKKKTHDTLDRSIPEFGETSITNKNIINDSESNTTQNDLGSSYLNDNTTSKKNMENEFSELEYKKQTIPKNEQENQTVMSTSRNSRKRSRSHIADNAKLPSKKRQVIAPAKGLFQSKELHLHSDISLMTEAELREELILLRSGFFGFTEHIANGDVGFILSVPNGENDWKIITVNSVVKNLLGHSTDFIPSESTKSESNSNAHMTNSSGTDHTSSGFEENLEEEDIKVKNTSGKKIEDIAHSEDYSAHSDSTHDQMDNIVTQLNQSHLMLHTSGMKENTNSENCQPLEIHSEKTDVKSQNSNPKPIHIPLHSQSNIDNTIYDSSKLMRSNMIDNQVEIQRDSNATSSFNLTSTNIHSSASVPIKEQNLNEESSQRLISSNKIQKTDSASSNDEKILEGEEIMNSNMQTATKFKLANGEAYSNLPISSVINNSDKDNCYGTAELGENVSDISMDKQVEDLEGELLEKVPVNTERKTCHLKGKCSNSNVQDIICRASSDKEIIESTITQPIDELEEEPSSEITSQSSVSISVNIKKHSSENIPFAWKDIVTTSDYTILKSYWQVSKEQRLESFYKNLTLRKEPWSKNQTKFIRTTIQWLTSFDLNDQPLFAVAFLLATDEFRKTPNDSIFGQE